ncbi:Holliday junction branch migration protein RuvA [Desulfonatronospira sp. MSAO_Bac3]|uniref:Holliday junction branch migration protein RuvA n=1 Tax=Desulfonatronospira sp. MSAO_Bac3 TaxID=2293857 RepID=UPI0002DEC7CA|nr:Holliday junction branch migration protein RuvA [Desulfonatronospira sp. MSAO_Bac3]
MSFNDKSCLVMTASGLGYEVHVSAMGLQNMPGQGEELELHTSMVVREDALDLYGFFTRDERETFNVLLNAPKLGPKTALAILGIFSPSQIQKIINTEDEAALTQVPGIGSKTARRLILDLKDRLGFISPQHEDPRPAPGPRGVRQDVLAGLTSLGYSAAEVTPLLDEVLEKEPDLDVSSAIRAVLKEKAREKLG